GMLRGTLADCGVSTMSENGTEVPEQVVKLNRRHGHAVMILRWMKPDSHHAKTQRAADLANENCDRAMKLAHKLSMQLRAAEDQINQLEAEVELFRDRAVCAERWLQTIQKEIEEKLIARDQPTATEQSSLPKDAEL